MKKIPHLLLILLGIFAALLLTWGFGFVYLSLGFASESWANNTLFALLKNIDYSALTQIFLMTLVYMFLTDNLIIGVLVAWHRTRDLKPKKKRTLSEAIRHYWGHYRRVHLTFILLTIFLTVAVTAPSNIVNVFTAIVSITVLVSNLTKKIAED